MDDLLSRPRALRTLRELGKREPFTMRQFMEASAYVWESADRLLSDLEEDGLIEVHTHREGSVSRKEIWLTEQARLMMPHIEALENLHAKAKKRH